MKKIILVTFLMLTSILIFAEECTIVSFNIMGRNEKDSFQKAFAYLIKENKADIVLLQEVKIPKDYNSENSTMEKLTKYLEGSWKWYTTFNEITKECPSKQNNVILVRRGVFDKVCYLTDKCESRYNNVQALEVNTGKEKLIVVNAHVSPNKRYQTKNFHSLKKFIENLSEKNVITVPLVLGGDLNYTTEKLRDGIGDKKFDYRWIIDGPENEVPDTNPWVTSVGLNPWDHFIFNREFEKLIVKKRVIGFPGKYGMRHAFVIDEVDGVQVGEYEWLTLGETGTYKKNISDHFPICITIDSDKM